MRELFSQLVHVFSPSVVRFHQQLDRFRRDGLERERYERMRELGVTFPGKGQFARGGRVKMTRDEEEYLEALRARAAAGRSLEMPASYETGDGLKLGQWYVGTS